VLPSQKTLPNSGAWPPGYYQLRRGIHDLAFPDDLRQRKAEFVAQYGFNDFSRFTRIYDFIRFWPDMIGFKKLA
jgi:hypothetical protein